MMALVASLLLAAAVGLGAYALLTGRTLRARSAAAAVSRVAVGQRETPSSAIFLQAHPILPRLLLAALCFTLGLIFLPPIVAAILGVVGFFIKPMLDSSSRARRRQQIADTLPMALSRLASEIASGVPLPDALQDTAESVNADPRGKPLADILRRTAADARSQGPDRALETLQSQADVPPLAYIAAVLRLHAGAGGHFERPLQRMADDYQNLSAQVNAARAELSGARSTAFVLILFAVIAAFINIARASGPQAFYRTPAGTVVLAIIAIWMAVGYFVINRMLSEVL